MSGYLLSNTGPKPVYAAISKTVSPNKPFIFINGSSQEKNINTVKTAFPWAEGLHFRDALS